MKKIYQQALNEQLDRITFRLNNTLMNMATIEEEDYFLLKHIKLKMEYMKKIEDKIELFELYCPDGNLESLIWFIEHDENLIYFGVHGYNSFYDYL